MPSSNAQFCKRNHDTFVCGRDKASICKLCRKEAYDRIKILHPRIKKQICKNDHDTFVTGRYKDGHCIECCKTKRISHPRQPKRFCKYRHDTFECGRIKGYCRICHNLSVTKWAKNNPKKRSIIMKRTRNKSINRKLAHYLRVRIRAALKKNIKNGSAVKDLGCSLDFLKEYIESKFLPGMTWNNWGKVWDLDHKDELHTFDLTYREQFLKAVNYTNLQPLSIPEHKKKTIEGFKTRRKS
jgi:hypothetical protein